MGSFPADLKTRHGDLAGQLERGKRAFRSRLGKGNGTARVVLEQGRGTEVIVLNQNFTADDLRQARVDCRGETGKTPIQAEAKAASSEPETTVPTPAPIPTVGATKLSLSSTPSGADIDMDGDFVGSTPSSITVAAGQHNIAVTKTGFAVWNKKITTSGGHVTIDAELAREKSN